MYSSTVQRQQTEIKELEEEEELQLPDDFENILKNIKLSNEVRAKLLEVRPANLGAARRIPGMTPAALMILLHYVKKQKSAYSL